MNYGRIKYYDIANGTGVRTSLFISGCYRHCPGCFSPETWSFDYGEPFTKDTENEILESLKPDYIAGLSVIGGDPMESRKELIPFLKKVKETYPEKTIWFFTGYTWSEIALMTDRDSSVKELIDLVDVLKCGPFIESQAEAGLVFKGSRNQELVDMNKTRSTGEKVLWKGKHI